MVQADGIMMSFVAPIRNHDAKVIMSSNMFTMVNTLYVDGQPDRLVKCVTDKTYPRNEHFRPAFTNTELCAMPPLERDQAKMILKQNNKKRIVVEFTFNNILTKYNHFDWFRKFRITQSGKNNWKYLHASWDIAVLMYNLYICADQHGDITTGTLGVEPPTVYDYLKSANEKNLIHMPNDNEGEGDGDVVDGGGEYEY